jgi:hypothetical protein
MIIDKAEEFKKLNMEKQNLIRLYDSKQISETDYINQSTQIQIKLTQLQNNIIKVNKPTDFVKMEPKTTVVDKVKNEPKIKKPIVMDSKIKTALKTEITPNGLYVEGTRINSLSSNIVRLLGLGKIKNIEQLISEIKKIFPNESEKTITRQLFMIKYDVKNKKGNWAKIVWDNDNFSFKIK